MCGFLPATTTGNKQTSASVIKVRFMLHKWFTRGRPVWGGPSGWFDRHNLVNLPIFVNMQRAWPLSWEHEAQRGHKRHTCEPTHQSKSFDGQKLLLWVYPLSSDQYVSHTYTTSWPSHCITCIGRQSIHEFTRSAAKHYDQYNSTPISWLAALRSISLDINIYDQMILCY